MNIIKDVINLTIYDEFGREITALNCLKECILQYRAFNEENFIIVEDILFNLDLLKQIGNPVKEKHINDFDKRISSNSGNQETIKFNRKKKDIKLKLVGSGVIYDTDTAGVSHEFDIVMPKVELIIGRGYEFSNEKPTISEYYFKILPYNEDEDLFDIVLKERT